MSQACENFVQSKVVSIGNFDVVEKTGYPTVIDIQNAGLFAMRRLCLENGLKWENGTCKYSAEQCTVKSSQTCFKGLQDPLGAGKLKSCASIPEGTEGSCCLKRPPVEAWASASAAITGGLGAGYATYLDLKNGSALPKNHFKNMSYVSYKNTEHNVFGYDKNNIADISVGVNQKACDLLGGNWDKIHLKCNLKPNYQRKVRHTCVIPSVGVPTQSGKSRETWSAQDLAEAKAACSKLKGEFSKTKGCVVKYKTPSLQELKSNPLFIEKNIASCQKNKGFFNSRNVVYKEQHGNKCVIGVPYENIRKFCELPSSRISKDGKPTPPGFYNVPPFRYNTNYKGGAFNMKAKKGQPTWNKSDWLCAGTKSYCDMHEMDYQSNPLASNAGCYESVGEKWTEFFLGKTMVRNFKRDVVENVKDAYTNCGGGPKASFGNELKGVGCGIAAAVGGTGEFLGDTIKDVGDSIVHVGRDIGNFFSHL